MADHLTEEEQIETIKNWWRENWFSVVLPIVLAALAYTAWNYWGNYQATQAQLASDKYQALIEVVEGAGDLSLSDEAIEQATSLAVNLSESHGGTLYADMAELILARLSVDAGNLAVAEVQLQKVVDGGQTAAVKNIARSRLAKVLLAQEKYDAALAMVVANSDPAMKAQFAEIRGDIYLDQDLLREANTAYQEALDSLDENNFSRRSLLQFKLQASASDEEEEASADAETANAEGGEVEGVEEDTESATTESAE